MLHQERVMYHGRTEVDGLSSTFAHFILHAERHVRIDFASF